MAEKGTNSNGNAIADRESGNGYLYDRRIGACNIRRHLFTAIDGAESAGHRPLELEVDEGNRRIQYAEDFETE